MKRRLLSLALLGSAPAHADPPATRLVPPKEKRITSGAATAETPRTRIVDPELTRRVLGAKVHAPAEPLGRPAQAWPWIDVPRPRSDEDDRVRVPSGRVTVQPMSSPTGGTGVRIKIAF